MPKVKSTKPENMAHNHELLHKSLMNKLIKQIIFFCLGAGIAIAGILTLIVVVVYPRLPSMNELRNYQPKLPLKVYSDDKVLLGQFGEERRIYIPFNKTPKMLVDAILAAEDERFYQHGGIDYIGVIRAAGLNMISGYKQSGASTITMQVARNFFLTSQKTYTRKFNEALLAYKIEHSLTKNQILDLYINQIYLGQKAYGFAEAAITYFAKPLDKLTIAEFAILASLPKAPSAYNPIVNPKRSHDRQLYVLKRMLANHFITESQYQIAIKQPIIVAKNSVKDATDAGGYVAEMVRQMLYAQYGNAIYTKGYKVYTTVDSHLQKAAYTALRNGLLKYDAAHSYRGAEEQLDLSDHDNDDDSLDENIMEHFDDLVDYGDLQAAIVTSANSNHVRVRLRDGKDLDFNGTALDWVRNYLNSGNAEQLKLGSVIRVRNINGQWVISQLPIVEGALVAINPNNGAIRSLIGGFDFSKNNFNHVTQAMRQPGSGFKPFIYSAALADGLNANTKIDDSEICYPSGGADGGQWCPRNDDNDFLGPITLRQALADSRNVVTVKLLQEITPAYAINYVSKFGFDTSKFEPYLTMALGANEVTPLQMAKAMAVFANGGYLVEPYLITYITDDAGHIIAKTSPINVHTTQVTPVIDPRNAFVMNSILQDVARYGTGARAYRVLQRLDIAGKTGTTTDAKDVWFNGYTPNLVTITWVGFDTPQSLGAHQYGATLALPIWIDFMSVALNNMPQVTLPMPPGITVIPKSTWVGNNEYIYDSKQQESKVTTTTQAIMQESATKSESATVIDSSILTPDNLKDDVSAPTTNSESDNNAPTILAPTTSVSVTPSDNAAIVTPSTEASGAI